MKSYVQKWGNSLGIRIPKQIAQMLHLQSGAEIELSLQDDHLVISKKEQELDALLAQITPTNLHHEILDDDSKGSEVW